MKKYRCKIELAADILSASLKCEKKTHIMNHCNLNFRQLNIYLNMLVASDLLSYDSAADSYVVTGEGKKFLRLFKVYKGLALATEKRLAVVKEKKSQLEQMCLERKTQTGTSDLE